MEGIKALFATVYHSSGVGRGSGYGYSSGDGFGCGCENRDGFSDGCGYGLGSGRGSGYGYGDGSGYGCGYGLGSGDGSGDGYVRGEGLKMKSFCGETVYNIDGVATILDRVHGNVAKGRILRQDLTTERCYIVKQDGLFTHGATLGEAMQALTEKRFYDMPEEARIDAFVKTHEYDQQYANRDFYDWHHRLTGSCALGRETFARERGIHLEDAMTTREFLSLTKDAYGGRVIRKVMERYGSC